jgi:uncharacterized membrane protein
MGIWLFIHIIGAVLFIGNILMAAYWKLSADRSGNLAVIHKSAADVMRADYVFTIPGIAMLLTSGHVMAERYGYDIFSWSWLGISYGLLILSGVLWAVVLLPTQRRMIREAAQSLVQNQLTAGYRRASLRWNAFGSIATILPLVVLLLMVFKRLP